MKYVIITNNKLVNEYYLNEINFKNLEKIIFMETASFINVLEFARDSIHKGHKLLTHPLTGSVKPYETPFKSVVISSETTEMDFESLNIIENSIEVTKKFLRDYKPRNLKEKHLKDFMIIDKSLIDSGIESINQVY
ncbi:GrdX family protein [Helicovermis profundi]|uniref:GrdX family protein n=1 Tax=Helicovermis profundi TaxID=3065157 RepID=A0AAU9EQG5_9FIRM|nr:GrdX family protein [Clostridia bacterium S502]